MDGGLSLARTPILQRWQAFSTRSAFMYGVICFYRQPDPMISPRPLQELLTIHV